MEAVRTPRLEHVFESHAPEETVALGQALGELLLGTEFIGLSGELGAGKTRFVRGLSKGAQVPDDVVASPTFAIVNPYAGRIHLHHADLYRLESPDELYATGFYDLIGRGALVVEWIDKVPEAVPEDALVLSFRAPDADDETLRQIHARAYGERSGALLARWIQRFASSAAGQR